MAIVLLAAPAALRAGSGDEEDETPQKPVFRTGMAYESNIFEVNQHREAPSAAWYQESDLKVARPLRFADGSVAATFHGATKLFFGPSQLDEYRIQPGLTWEAVQEKDSNLLLDIRAARFSEPVGAAFLQRQPLVAVPGWSGGAGWKWERDVTEKTTLKWTGGAELQAFDSFAGSNLEIKTRAELVRGLTEGVKWTVATEWAYQHYRERPQDDESVLNPSRLSTVEGRAVTGLELNLGNDWHAELEMNGGYNGDLTNGYYDASVLGARVELRWEKGPWTVKAVAEPEQVWFRRRPANIDVAHRVLSTQEYVFELRIDYSWSERVTVFCQHSIHVQRTNSDESLSDATLNRFNDQIGNAGFAITF